MKIIFFITRASIPIMLKAFSCGTRYVLKSVEWNDKVEESFFARCYYDTNAKLIYIRVSNDERRRLIPVLMRLQNSKEHLKSTKHIEDGEIFDEVLEDVNDL